MNTFSFACLCKIKKRPELFELELEQMEYIIEKRLQYSYVLFKLDKSFFKG